MPRGRYKQTKAPVANHAAPINEISGKTNGPIVNRLQVQGLAPEPAKPLAQAGREPTKTELVRNAPVSIQPQKEPRQTATIEIERLKRGLVREQRSSGRAALINSLVSLVLSEGSYKQIKDVRRFLLLGPEKEIGRYLEAMERSAGNFFGVANSRNPEVKRKALGELKAAVITAPNPLFKQWMRIFYSRAERKFAEKS
ncbi:MAG: hypothetical protein V1493_01985 [Candidatus Diapherotrites archaeon]